MPRMTNAEVILKHEASVQRRALHAAKAIYKTYGVDSATEAEKANAVGEIAAIIEFAMLKWRGAGGASTK